jgi:hypothetical protein
VRRECLIDYFLDVVLSENFRFERHGAREILALRREVTCKRILERQCAMRAIKDMVLEKSLRCGARSHENALERQCARRAIKDMAQEKSFRCGARSYENGL